LFVVATTVGFDSLESKFLCRVDEDMVQLDEDRSAELDRLRRNVVSMNGSGAAADERVPLEDRDIQWDSSSI